MLNNALDCGITEADFWSMTLAELDRMIKSKERVKKAELKEKAIFEITRIENKLSNEGFVAKAPKAVVDGEKAKLESHKGVLAGIEAALAKLG